MIGQGSPYLQHLRLQKDAQKLQMMLVDMTEQLSDRNTLIEELQHTISHLTSSTQISQSRKSTFEEEIQCSFEEDREEVVRSLSEVLAAREQEGVSLHLASRQKQEENAQLREALADKEEELKQMKSKVQSMEGFLEISMSDFDYLCNQNKNLREKIMKYETEKSQLENRVIELEAQSEQWECLKQEKISIMQQRLKMQGEEQLTMKEIEQKLKDELNLQITQAERSKAILNNYEWKLFCLETELDLCNKDRKQLKFMAQKHEIQQSKLEHALKEKRIEIFSWEEENRMLSSENRYLSTENKSKGEIIDKLQAEISTLKHDIEEHEQFKEMSYSLKEKEDQMNEIMLFLKEKIGELDKAKHKISFLEKELHETKEEITRLNEQCDKRQEDVYELEQTMVDGQMSLDQQLQMNEQLQKALDDSRKQLQDNSMLQMLRSSEWNQIRNSLETSISQQAQKINMLSVEIIERDIAAKKSAEQLAQSENNLRKYNKQLVEVYMRLEQAEEQMTTLCEMRASREDQLQRAHKKVNNLQQNIKEKEKIITVLQGELKMLKNQVSHLNKINGEHEEKIYIKEEEISSLREKVVDQIEEELNYEFKIEEMTKQNNRLKANAQQSQKRQEVQQALLENYRTEIKKLQETTQARLQELTDLICPPDPEEEPTTKFEVLEEQFQIIELDSEKRQIQIKEKLIQCREELAKLASKLL